MKSFRHFLSQLATIPDPRRAEGKLYQLPHVLLFSIFAIVSGANSYRGIRTFIKVHRPQLNRAFKIRWKRPPAHTAIRYILQGLSPADVENVFRQHAADLNHAGSGPGTHVVAFDGKALKGSFDNFNDVKAKQGRAFAVYTALVLAHIEIDEKSNEIPAVQKLLEELNVAGHRQVFDFLVAVQSTTPGARRSPSLACGQSPSMAYPLKASSNSCLAALSDRLLFVQDGRSIRDRVRSLLLDDPTGDHGRGLERFLRDVADHGPFQAVQALAGRPDLWLGSLQPCFSGEILQAIKLIPWRGPRGDLVRWSGLKEPEEPGGLPRLILDRDASAKGKAQSGGAMEHRAGDISLRGPSSTV